MNYKTMILFCVCLASSLGIFLLGLYLFKRVDNHVVSEVFVYSKDLDSVPDNNKVSVKISAVGDCTIGWDDSFSENGRFDSYLKDNNYGYYFDKVKDIFADDDLTIVNLEGVLTNSEDKVSKKFNYKASPDYVEVLKKGNVDVVSFANNHTHDYGEAGYEETLKTLDESSIDYYGYRGHYLIKDINGVKVGLFAFLDVNGLNYSVLNDAINYMKKNRCNIIIASMHWGNMYNYTQDIVQINMAHYLIDNGVDLVIGHHPHVLQGIEKYKDKYILYSLGNFVYGGNPNPSDKDSIIWQQTFTFYKGKLKLDDNIKIIPVSLSGVKNLNNYQPVILKDDEKARVLNKLLTYSSGFNYVG